MKKASNNKRIKIEITGAIQGVGFRPFIFNLANKLKLKGWIKNTSQGVLIEAEGGILALNSFIEKIQADKPIISYIQGIKYKYLDLKNFSSFQIVKSTSNKEKTTLIFPDIATCKDCASEIFDQTNRRYLYPFTNCTNCGPRYTILEKLPYDRQNTSMKKFVMCEYCQSEYDDPKNRRFHAQPNACHLCGPQVQLLTSTGEVLSEKQNAIEETIGMINNGKILAIKGIGGFHLVCDANNKRAIERLRERKNRDEKPFALMFRSVSEVQKHCNVSRIEKQMLESPEAPIVLLERKMKNLPDIIAPKNPYIGVMLPYSPLHHIVLNQMIGPIVATSANLKDDPICIDNNEALISLCNVADFFLVHNREIVRHVDDSVERVIKNRPMMIRRSRGFAPFPIGLKKKKNTVMAVGGHLKNTVSLIIGKNCFVSPHIGDLETVKSLACFKSTVEHLSELYDKKIDKVACDMHPDYLSTKEALKFSDNVLKVQHHHAHIVSCMAENEIGGKVLGVAFDGTGFGLDLKVWGGEFLVSSEKKFKRTAHFLPFKIPSGEKAIKEPRKIAFGLLYEIFKKDLNQIKGLPTLSALSDQDQKNLSTMLEKNFNVFETSSVGRIFDAVASIVGLRQIVNFEGQAAMELEFAIKNCRSKAFYDFEIIEEIQGESHTYIIDWRPSIVELIEDVCQKKELEKISVKFHNTLTEIIVEIAKIIKIEKVVLSGGCFQNKYLTEHAIDKLEKNCFKVYWHQDIPPNDGGISLGQAVIAASC